MFRAERPQRGRYRQFYQLGAEVFGDPGPGVRRRDDRSPRHVPSASLGIADAQRLRELARRPRVARALPRRPPRYLTPKKGSLGEESQRRLDEPAPHPRLEGPARPSRPCEDAPARHELPRARPTPPTSRPPAAPRRARHAVTSSSRASSAASTTTRAPSSRSKGRPRSSARATPSSAAAGTTTWSPSSAARRSPRSGTPPASSGCSSPAS
jgi:hypothetical protein